MRKGRILMSGLALLAICFPSGAAAWQTASKPASQVSPPRVFLIDAQKLLETKRRVLAGDQNFDAALAKLDREAKKALEAGPFSVLSKQATPPSGDKHDYMSQAPYFWPNPKTATGLPYVRRDGERNPAIEKISDHQNLGKLITATGTLGLAYYLKGDEAYAVHAARLLRVWFLDPATRMNPHLNYSQAIPGVNDGRGTGIIESRGLAQVIDAVGMLAGSRAWTEADQKGLQAWFEQYLRWLLESRHGRDEAAAKNNHGTYYDVQVASFALFTGQRELAEKVLRQSLQKRVASQIEPDGRQPLELARTRAWGYSVMNLQGLFSLAALGEQVGVDVWYFQTADGRGLRRALDYFIPFAAGEQKWPYKQITEWSPAELAPLLRRAAIKYHERKYEELIQKVAGDTSADRMNLLYPQ